MIVKSNRIPLPFSELHSGAIFQLEQRYFMKLAANQRGVNTVDLEIGFLLTTEDKTRVLHCPDAAMTPDS